MIAPVVGVILDGFVVGVGLDAWAKIISVGTTVGVIVKVADKVANSDASSDASTIGEGEIFEIGFGVGDADLAIVGTRVTMGEGVTKA